MRRHARTVLGIGWLILAVGLVAADDSAREEAIRKDRAKYEGIWRVVSLEMDGTREPDRAAQKITVTNYRDGTWVVKVDGLEAARGASRIDPTRKPKTIDFTPAGDDSKGQTLHGIYEIDGNSRRLCFAGAGKERPTDFSARPGSGHVLVVLRREKLAIASRD
jgi:uncharacterized protein (TIGR03067 family)